MLRGFPLTEKDNIKFLDNMWRVVLPDDCEYTETWHDRVKDENGNEKEVPREEKGYQTLPFMVNNKPVVYRVARTEFLEKDQATKWMNDHLNEWARKKGGRPKGS